MNASMKLLAFGSLRISSGGMKSRMLNSTSWLAWKFQNRLEEWKFRNLKNDIQGKALIYFISSAIFKLGRFFHFFLTCEDLLFVFHCVAKSSSICSLFRSNFERAFCNSAFSISLSITWNCLLHFVSYFLNLPCMHKQAWPIRERSSMRLGIGFVRADCAESEICHFKNDHFENFMQTFQRQMNAIFWVWDDFNKS